MVMEFIDGMDLEHYLEHLRGKKATYPMILSIMRDIANAMDYIHDHNVLHLDLRCANVMVWVICSINQPTNQPTALLYLPLSPSSIDKLRYPTLSYTLILKIDRNGKALVSDFGISLVTSTAEYNPIPSEYAKVHYCGKPIYQSTVFDELREDTQEKNTSSYTHKFDVVFYGILLWKILTRYCTIHSIVHPSIHLSIHPFIHSFLSFIHYTITTLKPLSSIIYPL